MSKYSVCNKYILVKPEKEAEETESGLLVAKTEGERTESVARRGIIVQTPPGVTQVKAGDAVYVAKWEAQKVFIAGSEYLIVKEEDILLRVEA